MKLIFIKIKSLIPYLLLILLYFFFINLEARKTHINNKSEENKNNQRISDDLDKTKIRIKIPVIPFNLWVNFYYKS